MNAKLERFTLDGGDELEEHLRRTCLVVRKSVEDLLPPAQLQGLLLGGGYGRGEGGVLRTVNGEHPYNDLEFYVLVGGNVVLAERRLRDAFHEAGEGLSLVAGVEVEFKLCSTRKIQRSPVTMFYYDLIMGHRWLIGSDELLSECEHHRDASRIPLCEATRLLMNRCTGLLLSLDRLARAPFLPEDADFVGRNLAKAQLGLGDCVLSASGQYHWSCLERGRRIQSLSFDCESLPAPQIREHHAAGVQFKLHPIQTTQSREALALRVEDLSHLALKVWLWLESRRLRVLFRSPSEYALASMRKCPETKPVRNLLINLRTFGVSGLLGKHCWRYPRERLLNSLVLLLFDREMLRRPATLAVVQRALRSNESEWGELVSRYQSLWSQFS